MATPNQIQDEDGAIIAIKNFIGTARTDLRTENSRIGGQIDSWRPQWQGDGSDSFNNFRGAWDTRFAALMATLDEFEASLGATSADFQSTDFDSGSAFQGLTATIE